jgi:hypothetical protein
MGNTTIIELNHDQVAEIKDHPQEFVQQILDQLGSFEYSGKEILGGKVIAGFHRSGHIYDMWEKFKQRLYCYLSATVGKIV